MDVIRVRRGMTLKACLQKKLANARLDANFILIRNSSEGIIVQVRQLDWKTLKRKHVYALC